MGTNNVVPLKLVVPVAETAGVKLACHPDDPPVPTIKGEFTNDEASYGDQGAGKSGGDEAFDRDCSK